MKIRWSSIRATIVAIAWLMLLVSACSPAPATPLLLPPSPPSGEGTVEPTLPSQETGGPAEGMATAAAARTPIPTPTPNAVERSVNKVADDLGLSGSTFLGRDASNWAELLSSLITIILGYIVARILVSFILKRIIDRTSTKFDDQIFAAVHNELRWFVVLIFADYALLGLSFLDDTSRTRISDLIFILVLILLTSMALGLIRIAANHYKTTLAIREDQKRLEPVITGAQRFGYFLVLILALSVGLGHFGADTNTLYITLIIIILIVSLAAKDVITDGLNGFIILADQPFREGDSVHIKDLNTWGDVLSIGTRTTRIRTVDNRELIVPNSQVAKSQIVNYNYPDPKYRLQTDIVIAFGTDVALIRRTATEAVRSVEYVLNDEPVDVLFIEFAYSGRKIRVRWWIATFHDEWYALDAVNNALETAFQHAQIQIPHEIYDLRVRMEDESRSESEQ